MTTPRISVLMPVYNGGAYLRPAIDSILAQTFTDFEFLIIDDGSTDDSLAIARSYADPRIRLEPNGRNLGLIATLNRGLGLVRGEYIARMDCDDISFPGRLARQVAMLDRHPEIGLCGTWFERVEGKVRTIIRPPLDDGVIRLFLTFQNAFAHNTIMLRRSIIERYQLRYDPQYPHAEDYEFWTRCAEHTRLANLPEVLLRYHYHPANTSSRFAVQQGETADRVRRRQLQALGLPFTESEIALHHALAKFQYRADTSGLRQARDWLERLIEQGCRRYGVAPDEPRRQLARYWYGACGKRADQGLAIWRLFRSAPIGRAAPWEWQAKLWLRCLLRRPIPAPPTAAIS